MRNFFKKSSILITFSFLFSFIISTPQPIFATNTLKLAYQYGTAVEKFSITIGETKDLRFLGAPTNWSSLHPFWYSSDPSVAEVDSSGVVTAKSEGSATIFLVLDNGMMGSTIVEVTTPEILETPIPSEQKLQPTFTIAKKSENGLILTFSNLDTTILHSNNFEVVGAYFDAYGEYKQTWNISSIQIDQEKQTVLLTTCDKLLKDFTYTVTYIDNTEEIPKKIASTILVNDTSLNETPTKLKIVLQNQEAIHIPINTTFADGTPIQNVRDIAKYAFSYMLSDETPVIPTYEANATGVADIAKVTYRTNKGAKSVIIQKVYLKVYLDPNQDNWVTAAEKAEDALGYYLMEVEIDKTLTVEDWSIVID